MSASEFFAATVFVLGAADPEMNRIEAVLRHLGADAVYAAFRGVDGTVARVHGGVAYKATLLLDSEGRPMDPSALDGSTPVWVECAVQDGDRSPESSYVLDHHNPGDPGFGGAPELFWESSSLGQLWKLLLDHGVDAVAAAAAFGEDARLLAASDHCPSHAFQNRCPGIDVGALRSMRRANAAQFQKKELAAFDAEVDAAVAALLSLPEVVTSAGTYRVSTGDIPQLNHAQLEAGVPVEYRMQGNTRDPRVKVGLLGGEPELIKLWMDSKAGSLVDIYGDPARGYAGGYLPA